MSSNEEPSAAYGRADFVTELERYRAADARERSMLGDVRAFVERHPDAFERALATGHMTASAWIVDRTGTFTLLTHHRKLDKWLQLGGHADGDVDVRRVALREAREESGLQTIVVASGDIYDVDVHAIPPRGDEIAHLHYDVRFAFYADPHESPQPSAESHAVAWVPLAGIERYAIDDSVRRLVRKTPALVAGPIGRKLRHGGPDRVDA